METTENVKFLKQGMVAKKQPAADGHSSGIPTFVGQEIHITKTEATAGGGGGTR